MSERLRPVRVPDVGALVAAMHALTDEMVEPLLEADGDQLKASRARHGRLADEAEARGDLDGALLHARLAELGAALHLVDVGARLGTLGHEVTIEDETP